MADMRISELTTAAGLHDGDLFETSQTDSISSSGYASYKTSLNAIAAFIAKQVQYSGDLQTTSKTLIGAINEVFNAGTSVTVENVLPATETTKRVATITVDGVAKDINADDAVKVITDLKTPKSATITNGIAQFECIEENFVKGLKVTMSPIQDLHGQSTPYPAGGGKNKLPFDLATVKANNTDGTWNGNVYTYNGVVWTVSEDGKVKVNGTPTGDAILRYLGSGSTSYAYELPSADYKITTGFTRTGSRTTFEIGYRPTGESIQHIFNNDGYGLINANVNLIQLVVREGYMANNLEFEPMIVASAESDYTFAPYSNICPISGRTEASVTRTAGEDVETKTHQYSETIYGGVDDFVNGGMTSTEDVLDNLSSLNWYVSNNVFYSGGVNVIDATNDRISDFKCTFAKPVNKTWNQLADGECIIWRGLMTSGKQSFAVKLTQYSTVADFTNAIQSDWKFSYPKATPTAISTSAEEITTVAGTNIISGTEPISECKYTELATVDDLIKIIGGQ